MSKMSRHPGKTLLIGGTGGIGEALVALLKESTSDLTITARNLAKAEQILGPETEQVRHIELDLCDLEQATTLGLEIAREGFDSVVLNAGHYDFIPAAAQTKTDLTTMYLSNVIGPMTLLGPSIEGLIKRGGE